jgi:hypothetical protein
VNFGHSRPTHAFPLGKADESGASSASGALLRTASVGWPRIVLPGVGRWYIHLLHKIHGSTATSSAAGQQSSRHGRQTQAFQSHWTSLLRCTASTAGANSVSVQSDDLRAVGQVQSSLKEYRPPDKKCRCRFCCTALKDRHEMQNAREFLPKLTGVYPAAAKMSKLTAEPELPRLRIVTPLPIASAVPFSTITRPADTTRILPAVCPHDRITCKPRCRVPLSP